MELQGYYRKIRECEQEIAPGDTWLVSLATADGGREGVVTEASRRLAAKLIVDGKARLATPEEIEAEMARRMARRPGSAMTGGRIAIDGARAKKPAK